MASKTNQPTEKKPPQFFIPASYKGHQVIPPISAKTNPTGGVVTSAQQLGNHVGPSSRAGTPIGTIGKGASTDSAVSHPGKSGGYLLASPSGVLDLSLYNYTPATEKSASKQNGQSNSHKIGTQDQLDGITHEPKLISADGAETAVVEKEKKKRRFRRPRRNSKLDRLIRILEDKRVGDDEDGEELEDLQLPRLRKVLNIIFVTLGVCFLLAVIIVILYTSFATDTEALNDICMHRSRDTEPCQNSTEPEMTSERDINHVGETSRTTDADSSVVSSFPTMEEKLRYSQPSYPTSMNPSAVSGSIHTDPRQLPTLPSLHTPSDISINHIDNQPRPLDNREPLYPYSLYSGLPVINYGQTRQNQGNYPWSHRQYGAPTDPVTTRPGYVDEWRHQPRI